MAVGGAALAALLLAGCSSSLDTAQLESDLAGQLAVREQVGASQVRVECPDSVPLSSGSSFECQASVADRPLVLTVTELDGDGTVQWTARPAEVTPPG